MSDLTCLVVLISGSGTNLGAILAACEAGSLPAKVVAVVSNKAEAFGLRRAQKAGIPGLVHLPEKGKSRREYDSDLAELVKTYSPDYVILAGWMRILSMSFLRNFPMRVINLHPALPGSFPGADAISDAFSAYQAGEISTTGVMVHFVPDEGVDVGPVIASESVPILPTDSIDDLENRIHQVEHRLLVSALKSVIKMKED